MCYRYKYKLIEISSTKLDMFYDSNPQPERKHSASNWSILNVLHKWPAGVVDSGEGTDCGFVEKRLARPPHQACPLYTPGPHQAMEHCSDELNIATQGRAVSREGKAMPDLIPCHSMSCHLPKAIPLARSFG